MNVLILSMTVGQGHNSASYAIQETLEEKGHTCHILDTYKFLNRAVGEAFDKGYTMLGRVFPKVNANIYKDAERFNGRSNMKLYFPWLFADFNKTKMQQYILEQQPDVIVCTIVMTAMLVKLLRDSNMIDEKIKTYGIVTDYSLHPFWEYTDMDYFVCPNELMTCEMVERGIDEQRILPTGIPIRKRFSYSIEETMARERLSLENDLFTILVSAGGMGFSGIPETLAALDKMRGLQMVAVCGTNKRLFAKLNAMKFNNRVHVLGYVNNMDEYLDACDVIVTKPGGLSTSEAMAKEKPIVLLPPMPGVENMNQAFLVNHSLAVHTSGYAPIHQVIGQLQINEDKLQEMKRAHKKWGKKHSSKTLCELMEGQM
ncbi:MAG: MGDG synthase family glycosyltransferase [Christensenellaceae bacterium]|jgi:processive 1,2-diacylglycerol beta-glucosyltransferase